MKVIQFTPKPVSEMPLESREAAIAYLQDAIKKLETGEMSSCFFIHQCGDTYSEFRSSRHISFYAVASQAAAARFQEDWE